MGFRFSSHPELEGKHAFLGASKYHWINYDIAKMEKIWTNQFASERGTRLHKLAKMLIDEGIRMKDDGQTLNAYVNDAIRYRMTPEVLLKYTDNSFGTADAISFEKRILRIHDLKTGVHPGSPHQLEIYAALFCTEYDINPYDIEMLFAIYQGDEIFPYIGDPARIVAIQQKMRDFDKHIDKMKEVML